MDVRHTPRAPSAPTQGASTTYAAAAVTILWTAPVDTGCLPVLDYTVEATLASDDSSWVAHTAGVAALTQSVVDPGGGPALVVPG